MINLEAKIIEKLANSTVCNNGCIEWPGPFSNRYGYMQHANKRYRAHRVVYEFITRKNVPEGMEVHHVCNNGRCVNIAHLEIVTHSQNLIAARDDGKVVTKISQKIADSIRTDYEKGGETHRTLARKYSIHKSTITRILAKETWLNEDTKGIR